MPILFASSPGALAEDEEVRLTIRVSLVIDEQLPGSSGQISVTTSCGP